MLSDPDKSGRARDESVVGPKPLRSFCLSARRCAARYLPSLSLAALLITPVRSYAGQPPAGLDPDIAQASLEELLDLTITTATRMPEKLRSVSAAVTVITGEDIRRRGVRSIPEALRLIPGVEVARIDANKWAVSIRGFNSRLANKLLVMIDGRSIYNPLFSGTLWETKDVFIEDVERIEVIRGPGGSTWGSNAVNGVIHIITKKARDTRGGLAVAGGGTEEQGFTDLRYGAKLSDTTDARVYGKYYHRGDGYLPQGVDDDSLRGQGGFRLDNHDGDEAFMMQGSFDGGDHDGVGGPLDVSSRNRDTVIQGQWEKQYDRNGSVMLNGYYARTEFDSPVADDDRDTGEVNLQHSFKPFDRFDLTSGLQYRITADEVKNSAVLAVDPTERTDQLVSGFTRARFQLLPEQLSLNLGVRLEHNDYDSFEAQPEIAMSWTPNDRDVVWASVARAVRTPSRLESDFLITLPDLQTTFVGNRNLDSEQLIAYEIGYRRSLGSALFLDVATFWNEYEDLIAADAATISNSARGHVYGVELTATWEPTAYAKLLAGYSYLVVDLSADPGSTDRVNMSIQSLEGADPEHQAFGRADFMLTPDWSFGFDVRFVDSLRTNDVDDYVVGDARLAWRARQDLELAVVGQNLFRAHHFEQRGSGTSEVEQGVYGQLTWTF